MKKKTKEQYIKTCKRNSFLMKFCSVSWLLMSLYKFYLGLDALGTALIAVFFAAYAYGLDRLTVWFEENEND